MQDDQSREVKEQGKDAAQTADASAARESTFTRRALLRTGWAAVPVLFAGTAVIVGAKKAFGSTHSDTHSDTAYHNDTGHYDTDATHADHGHADAITTGGHADTAHFDAALQNNPPHTDEPHSDSRHLDTHTDSVT